jgi:hypothetical protein
MSHTLDEIRQRDAEAAPTLSIRALAPTIPNHREPNLRMLVSQMNVLFKLCVVIVGLLGVSSMIAPIAVYFLTGSAQRAADVNAVLYMAAITGVGILGAGALLWLVFVGLPP